MDRATTSPGVTRLHEVVKMSADPSTELLQTIAEVLDIRSVFPRVSEIANHVLPHDWLGLVFHDHTDRATLQARSAKSFPEFRRLAAAGDGDDQVVGDIEKARLLMQHESGRLALQSEKCGDDDGKKADQAAGERRPVGEAVLQQKTHDRQRDAGGSDQKHASPVEEPARHQHDDDVKHRDGEPERREGVDGENRRRKGNGDEGKERRRGE